MTTYFIAGLIIGVQDYNILSKSEKNKFNGMFGV